MNLLNWDSQQGRPFALPSQRNFPISFKPKEAIAEFFWKMQRKTWYSILGLDAMPLSLKNLLLSFYNIVLGIVKSVNSTNAYALIVILHDRRFQLCFDDIHTTQYCCWFMFWYVLESYDVQKVFTGCLHHVYRVIYNIISMTF